MVVGCCGHQRTQKLNGKSRTIAIIHNDSIAEVTEVKTISVENTANGGHTRNERHSLPDVVIPSTTVSAHHLFVDQRPSLQIDTERGRRPTMDLETTARLAKSESTGFDDSGETLKSAQSVGQNPTDNEKRHSQNPNVAVLTDSSIPPGNNKSEANSVERHKPGLLFRLFSRRTICNPFRRKPVSTRGEVESIHTTDQQKCPPNGDTDDLLQDTKEIAISGEMESQADQLGQLPVTDRNGRLARVKESQHHHVPCAHVDTDVPPSGRSLPMRHVANLRRGSLCVFSHVDELIVTPFAQILASLRRVRSNFILLTNISSSKDSRFGTSHTNLDEVQTLSSMSGHSDQTKPTASETLEELEWCLERLENVQTHRSVSDMATSKFRKMLSKELSQFMDGGRNSKQISEYICSTFLDSSESDAAVVVSEQSEESPTEHEESTTRADQTIVVDTSSGGNDGVTNHTDQIVSVQTTAADSTSGPTIADTSEALPSHLVPFGVTSNQPDQLDRLLSRDLDLWGLDIFDLARLTPNPLTCVFYKILQKRGLIKRFAIPEVSLIRYVNLVEEHYRAVPYHNRAHAADVVQSAHTLLNSSALSSVFTDLEVLAVLFACAIHDVDHPGLTNQYLINSNDHLAILYNDTSVLENHHLAVAFQLLTRPGCDIFGNLSKKQRLSLRRMTIDMVLATDMSKHMSLLADLKTMVETKKVAGSGILTLDNYSDRMQILQSMIHCADLSNPAKPLELYRKWNARVMEEHFRQGDRERERGLELSPMCDRTTASIEKTQVSFIDYIVHPLWETWSELVHPDAQNILDTLDDNRQWYFNQIVQESPLPPTSSLTATSHKGSCDHS